jgi:sulfate transport system ATP-binding protein
VTNLFRLIALVMMNVLMQGAVAPRACVSHVYGVGPIVTIELQQSDTGDLLEAQLTRKQYLELDPKLGEDVFVTPRNLRVFAEDYCI